MKKTPEVLVIGGGVIGCAIAYYLAKSGSSVAVLERGEIGDGASGASAGMLAPLSEAHQPGPFLNLMMSSLQLYPSLLGELKAAASEIDIEHQHIGVLRIAMNSAEEQELRGRYTWQRGLDQGTQWLDGREARRLEPNLSSRVCAAILVPNEQQLNSLRLAQALAKAAQVHGAVIYRNSEVRSFQRSGERVSGVKTRDGQMTAGQIVLAAGSWGGRMASLLGASVPITPVRGQLMALASESALAHIIWGAKGYLAPKPGGIIHAGTTVERVGFRIDTTRRGLQGIRSAASAMVPALGKATMTAAWAGLRPASADGLPVLGRLPGWENVWIAAGHFRNGILLTPVTGKLMAQLVRRGEAEIDLSPFSPQRFV
ncbi:MAG TPA: glycine oxidase ThiO [Dehalococcoidia bacterium]|nr:glycine oxidase ThiO [Dehalococcoidia bacterium]